MPLSLFDRWLLATLVGGGLWLLAVHLIAFRIRQPVRRLRWAEWGVVGALVLSLASLAPAWLIVPVPAEIPVVSPTVESATPEPGPVPTSAEAGADDGIGWDEPAFAMPSPEPAAETLPAPLPASSPPPVSESIDGWSFLVSGSLVLYALGAAFFLGRWLLGVIGLSRLLRRCEPAPEWVQSAARQRLAGVRVLQSPRVEIPFSCGVVRPTIVLPTGLAERATIRELDWVLAHELAHLRRGDPRSYWLLSLAAVLFYPFPWFWGLRARWRLDQEFLADAEAVECGPRVAYAEFLLQWTTRPAARRVPAAAVGVLGRSSDLLRRITMLLKGSSSLESRCPRLWTALIGPALLAVAVVAAGIGFRAVAAPVPADSPKDQKKAEPKPAPKPRPNEQPQEPAVPAAPNAQPFPGFPDLEDLLPPNLPIDPEQFKQLQAEMKRAREEARKAMENFRQQMNPRGDGQLFRLQPGQLLGRMNRGEGRLGVQVRRPSETLVDQLDLPRNQGLVLERVEDGSAAAKAGLKSHDILLELAGKPVTDNPADLIAQLKEIKADKAVEAVVLRKGKKETVKNLTLPEAKSAPQPAALNPFNFPNPFPGLPGGAATAMSVVRNGDSFTTTCTEEGVTFKLTGTVAEGKGTLTDVAITEDGKTTNYDSLDKVPEGHRDMVKKLIEMSASGKVQAIR